ncbi:hypothetical protein [Mesobacillus zeae]|uniref:Uncharacterized protein n=1 Tax=Mesobacillus zeae TaxID=1917180 RepID=A0A398B6Z1_9BACI|nr:hypothetical protein [Mesobacillus zeae]RID83476.1 hypothetical protein D1970_15750 [Mesobacillus zeae]
MNQCTNENDGLEKLLVSLIKMTGKTNEKLDELSKRVRQLEVAAAEPRIKRIYSFIADQGKAREVRKEKI